MSKPEKKCASALSHRSESSHPKGDTELIAYGINADTYLAAWNQRLEAGLVHRLQLSGCSTAGPALCSPAEQGENMLTWGLNTFESVLHKERTGQQRTFVYSENSVEEVLPLVPSNVWETGVDQVEMTTRVWAVVL